MHIRQTCWDSRLVPHKTGVEAQGGWTKRAHPHGVGKGKLLFTGFEKHGISKFVVALTENDSLWPHCLTFLFECNALFCVFKKSFSIEPSGSSEKFSQLKLILNPFDMLLPARAAYGLLRSFSAITPEPLKLHQHLDIVGKVCVQPIFWGIFCVCVTNGRGKPDLGYFQ